MSRIFLSCWEQKPGWHWRNFGVWWQVVADEQMPPYFFYIRVVFWAELERGKFKKMATNLKGSIPLCINIILYWPEDGRLTTDTCRQYNPVVITCGLCMCFVLTVLT